MKSANALAGNSTAVGHYATAACGYGSWMRFITTASAGDWFARLGALAGNKVGASAGSGAGMNWADAKGGQQ